MVRSEPARGQLVGYGTRRAPQGGWLTVVRCGYGDGFPRVDASVGSIVGCGMQYTIAHAILTVGPEVELVGADTNLDALATAAQIAPHEVVVRLGMGASYPHR